jgi:hypothetical protein
MKIKALIIALLAITLVGCESVSDQTTVEEYDTVGTTVDCYTDPETGVCYLIYSCGYQGGITVRYNADGSIMTKGDLK